MKLTDIQNAVRDARATLDRVDLMATELANLLAGRLRHVHSSMALETLKRELKAFNIHTGTWKQP